MPGCLAAAMALPASDCATSMSSGRAPRPQRSIYRRRARAGSRPCFPARRSNGDLAGLLLRRQRHYGQSARRACRHARNRQSGSTTSPSATARRSRTFTPRSRTPLRAVRPSCRLPIRRSRCFATQTSVTAGRWEQSWSPARLRANASSARGHGRSHGWYRRTNCSAFRFLKNSGRVMNALGCGDGAPGRDSQFFLGRQQSCIIARACVEHPKSRRVHQAAFFRDFWASAHSAGCPLPTATPFRNLPVKRASLLSSF